ncbi:DUF2161 domain-containing phosphodiesterase [Cognatishimia sp. F0-27]|uniref:DUF2161 domain-containing phosphodiesterase n=1 Tax=Cognatishimia sp. F0-27 TaxID=2816855 RepID=UPI001D0C8EC3|nr:DUF2161 family putative PD-(D/E)XK-type phosphodiesterase [Cognatishimia sp. F0-27]MCC1493945.1 hypothetical protein [Cognatishimia sp. F0-27]
MLRERELYAPIKAYLEARGYVVKGEVGAADLVARRPDAGDEAEPVIVELKLRISLALFHQAVARLTITDQVYIAVPKPTGKQARRALRDNRALCRRLGLGFLTVRATDGTVELHCDPGPYAPRKNKPRREKMLRAFDRLDGDPNDGGSTRHGLVTAYRQDAVKCAAYLAQTGPEKGSIVARACAVPNATRLMRDNHYGWFCKVETGVYALTEAGRRGLADWVDSV